MMQTQALADSWWMCRYGLTEDLEDSDEELQSEDEDPMDDMPAGKRPAKAVRAASRPALSQVDEDAAMDAGERLKLFTVCTCMVSIRIQQVKSRRRRPRLSPGEQARHNLAVGDECSGSFQDPVTAFGWLLGPCPIEIVSMDLPAVQSCE